MPLLMMDIVGARWALLAAIGFSREVIENMVLRSGVGGLRIDYSVEWSLYQNFSNGFG